jgi:acyl carrier protein
MTRAEVLAVVQKHILDVTEGLTADTFDPAASMKDLGINSLDIVEVVSTSMRELRVKVPRSELASLTNIDGLVDLLYAAVSAKAAAAAAAPAELA